MLGPFRILVSRYGVAASVAVLALVAPTPRVSATVIIFDTFTAANDTALIGRFPSPTDVPGAAYEGNGNVSLVGGPTGGTPYEADIQNNAARVGADAGLGLNLGISTAQQFQLSITFNISGDTQTQANNIHRGAGLGFFSSVSLGSSGTSHCFNNFTGLVVDRAGSVRLIVAGADSGLATIVGGFDPTITHTFSYMVDTTSGVGTMSNISWMGPPSRWPPRSIPLPLPELSMAAFSTPRATPRTWRIFPIFTSRPFRSLQPCRACCVSRF